MFASRGSGGERAISNLLGYILAVGVFTMVTVASLGVGFGVFTNAQESAQRTQVQHNSQVLAHSIEEVDRLSRASSSSERISRTVDLSENLGGVDYTVSVVDSGGESYILLESDDNAVSNKVPFGSDTDVQETTVNGGPVTVVREAGAGQIRLVEVDDA
jgi:hypothetical protein